MAFRIRIPRNIGYHIDKNRRVNEFKEKISAIEQQYQISIRVNARGDEAKFEKDNISYKVKLNNMYHKNALFSSDHKYDRVVLTNTRDNMIKKIIKILENKEC